MTGFVDRDSGREKDAGVSLFTVRESPRWREHGPDKAAGVCPCSAWLWCKKYHHNLLEWGRAPCFYTITTRRENTEQTIDRGVLGRIFNSMNFFGYYLCSIFYRYLMIGSCQYAAILRIVFEFGIYIHLKEFCIPDLVDPLQLTISIRIATYNISFWCYSNKPWVFCCARAAVCISSLADRVSTCSWRLICNFPTLNCGAFL